MGIKSIAKLFLVVSLVVLHGCASFEQNKVARITAMPDVTQYQNKPSVYFDLAVFRGKPHASPVKSKSNIKHFQKIVQNAAQKTDLFSEMSFDAEKQNESDYTLKIKLYNHGDEGIAFISGFLCGFTLGVVPGFAEDNFMLELEAIDNQGTVISSHTNEDTVHTWLGLWFIPFADNTPEKAIENTLEAQIKSALVELFNTQKLLYSATEFQIPLKLPHGSA